MAAVTGAIIVLNLVLVPRYYRYKSYYCVTKFSTLNLVTGAIIVPRYHLAPTAVFSVLSLPVPSSAKLSTSLVSSKYTLLVGLWVRIFLSIAIPTRSIIWHLTVVS